MFEDAKGRTAVSDGRRTECHMLELVGKYIDIGLIIQDDFPCTVCRQCQLILYQFYLFRQCCLKVKIVIRRRRLMLDKAVADRMKSEQLDDGDGEDGGKEEEMAYIRAEKNHYQCR